jgi:hypothetical protein
MLYKMGFKFNLIVNDKYNGKNDCIKIKENPVIIINNFPNYYFFVMM